MSDAHKNQQPAARPQMTQKREESEMDKVRDKYLESGADKAGELTVDYAAQELENGNAQQAYDNAKAEAQGLFSKYCGCFASLS